jgi:pSer/pThr/pTyr-binding forkhead associated (FHA) protein
MRRDYGERALRAKFAGISLDIVPRDGQYRRAMALTVVVRSGDPKQPPAITFDAPRIVIGRGHGCEVRLPDASVSHRHASIRQRGTDYIVVDEGSTNGTFVGPVRLSPQSPRMLKSGDLIRVGRIWLEVRIEHVPPTQNPGLATREIALGLVAGALVSQGDTAAVRVRVVEGPDAGRELLITDFERPHVLGRTGKVDLALDDPDVSRRHTEIFRKGAQLWVRDLGSKNGTRLGERTLDSGKEAAWPATTALWVGANRLDYEDPIAEALEDLERAADERMREEESVEPPAAAAAEIPEISEEARAGEPLPTELGQAAPIAVLPERAARPSAAKPGWGTTDLLVAVIALLVLAASIVGLLWLFGST